MKRIQSEHSHAILDFPSRLAKAEKLCRLLSEFTDLQAADLLDVGVGSGVITAELGKRCRSVHGVDVVDERVVREGYAFSLVEHEVLPFPDERFDVVVSNHVLPHVKDPDRHVSELWRVLRPGGFGYVAAPNRFFDRNYRLPFVSVLPRQLARPYFELVYGREYDVQPHGYWAFSRRLARFRRRQPVSTRVMCEPEKYHEPFGKTVAGRVVSALLRTLPRAQLTWLEPLSPTFIWLVQK